MTRPKRPTIERTLEHARKLKTLRENILDWRDEQRDWIYKLKPRTGGGVRGLVARRVAG
jgi:3-deoxy-D-arabino-heptulosonate 7-phosphate (DAHP) synthase